MKGPGMNLVMTVIGFAGSIMFIVFVCTRLIWARIMYTSSRRRRSIALYSRSDLGILECGLQGIEPLVLDKFPTLKFKDPLFSTTKDAQCTVCLADYHPEDTVRILPFCAHYFHATCIDIWFQQHSTCPVCRVSLREAPDKRQTMQHVPMFCPALRFSYPVDSGENTHCCLSHGHGFLSRTHDNRSMAPIRENSVQSEDNGPEAVESNSILATEGSRNKQQGSPSIA